MAQTGVVVLDDVLPRNALEAARDRKTEAWAGDVRKVIEVLRWRRPDLVVLLVHTAPMLITPHAAKLVSPRAMR